MARKDLCGMRALGWSLDDQYGADIQLQAALIEQSKQDQQARHMQLRVRLRDEAEQERLTRDLAIVINARKTHQRARTINNGSLVQELFGIDNWASSARYCNKLGLDPKESK